MTQKTQNDAKNAKFGLKNAKYAKFGLKYAKFGLKNAKLRLKSQNNLKYLLSSVESQKCLDFNVNC